jgi:LysR family glycine cleavage system transcriptional activator
MQHLPSTTALRCFDASARLLSFTKAAQAVNLTQSVVSHHIQALEQTLGVELFERDRSGLKLTPAGLRYWEDTSTLLHQLQRAAVRAVSGDEAGRRLNIAVPSAFANFWLMPRLSSFVESHPDIMLNLTNLADGENAFMGNDDAAIELCEGATPGIEAREVLSLVYQPYASASLIERHSLAMGANGTLSADGLTHLLSTAPLIRTSMVGAWTGWIKAAGLSSASLAQRAEEGPVYAQASLGLSAAMGGIGIALLPRYIVASAMDTGQLVRLSDAGWQANRSYFLRWPARQTGNPALKRFELWLASQAESEVAMPTRR